MPLTGKVLFASVQDGKIGSIYFEDGRIRLVHTAGPAIEVLDKGINVTRYSISEANRKKVDAAIKKKSEELTKEDVSIADYCKALKDVIEDKPYMVQPGPNTYLYEIYSNGATHPSRGAVDMSYNAYFESSPGQILLKSLQDCIMKYEAKSGYPEARKDCEAYLNVCAIGGQLFAKIEPFKSQIEQANKDIFDIIEGKVQFQVYEPEKCKIPQIK